jgi:hypothetical protein
MIIGINGYAGSGKDTIGKLIQLLHCESIGTATVEEVINDYDDHQWWLEEKSGWEIKKWAGKLKTIATMLTGIPQEKFEDQEFKMTDLGKEWSYHYPGEYYDDGAPVMVAMSVRQFLQKLGTEGLREGLHKNTWVNALMADYTPTQVQWADGPIGGYEDGPMPNWIITDTRFPNEAQAIKDAGGIVIRVDRPGVSAVNAHASETGLDNWDFDHKIMNGSDLVALMFTVHTILKKHNLYADHQTKNEDVSNA